MASQSSAPGQSQASNVQWQRRLFTDHPGKSSNNPMAKTGSGKTKVICSGKTKVICTLCLEEYILRDQNDNLMNGRETRSHDVLALGYFNADKDSSTRRQRVESNNPSTPVFSPAAQSKFETRIARINALVGFPLSWVENPEVIEFFQLFLLGAVLPTRGVLTRRLLANTLKTLQDAAWKPLHGAMGTLQADGWTGVNFHHLVGIMFAAAGSVHTVWVHDASDERKTARICWS
ncbi:hypothetical protein HMN09_00310100 [Mycena chlorophos]|uniref:Uncharacterized protein n=1 Tax=Mycena chlorophos TaxID=658473 RepID=A0A8H6TG26_MYCCL|nr:hypothetical protein HMN09_00310100 [Mycena chlorophos]